MAYGCGAAAQSPACSPLLRLYPCTLSLFAAKLSKKPIKSSKIIQKKKKKIFELCRFVSLLVKAWKVVPEPLNQNAKSKMPRNANLTRCQTKKQNVFNLQSFKTNKNSRAVHKDLGSLSRSTSTKVKVESGLGVKPAHIWLMDAWCTHQDFLPSFTVQPWKQIKLKKINQQNKPDD